MTTLQAVSTDLATLVAQRGDAIVRVAGRRRLAATGIVWSADGFIVTAHHVVERDEGVQVGLADGRTLDATVVGRDPGTDIAVLRVDATELTAAAWLDTAESQVGQLVLALGRPGEQVQATLGVISAVGGEWRTHAGGLIDTYLQTDVLMYPGFSGGPLLSAAGQFVGMNSSGLTRGTSVTIPANTVQRVAEAIAAHGHVPRGYLGIGVQPVRLADALRDTIEQELGLMVMSVEPDGPAATASLMQGDVLLALGEQTLQQVDQLQALLRTLRVGDKIGVQYLRGGVPLETTIVVGSSAAE